MFLNSLWGKFAQRHNQTRVKYFDSNEEAEYLRFISNPNIDITNFNLVGDNIIMLLYQDKAGCGKCSMKTNIFIGTFTTCYARLELYKLLDKLQERVLYFDTYSVIYISNRTIPNQYNPVLGCLLGELTSELKPNDYNICLSSSWL